MLAAVEARRQYHLDEARRRFRDPVAAIAHLDQAETIRTGDDVRRLRACLHLLAGDHPSAIAVL